VALAKDRLELLTATGIIVGTHAIVIANLQRTINNNDGGFNIKITKSYRVIEALWRLDLYKDRKMAHKVGLSVHAPFVKQHGLAQKRVRLVLKKPFDPDQMQIWDHRADDGAVAKALGMLTAAAYGDKEVIAGAYCPRQRWDRACHTFWPVTLGLLTC